MDCSPPGYSVHGILQARILEWVAISFSRGSFQPRDWTCVSCTGRCILYHWATGEAPQSLMLLPTECLASLLDSLQMGAPLFYIDICPRASSTVPETWPFLGMYLLHKWKQLFMDSQMSGVSLLQTARSPSVLGEDISNSFLKRWLPMGGQQI